MALQDLTPNFILVEVGLRTWQQYEEGVHDPSWKVVTKLSDLGYNADWLASGKGDIKRGDVVYSLGDDVNKSVLNQVESKDEFSYWPYRSLRRPVMLESRDGEIITTYNKYPTMDE